MRTFFHRSW